MIRKYAISLNDQIPEEFALMNSLGDHPSTELKAKLLNAQTNRQESDIAEVDFSAVLEAVERLSFQIADLNIQALCTQRTPPTETRVYNSYNTITGEVTTEELGFDPIDATFAATVKKAARPGMRMEQ